MSLINETYFIGELDIPNTNRTDVVERLQFFIDKYEEKFLTDLLGYELYKNFKAGVTAYPILSKWSSLRDGGEYTYNGRLTKWNGLIQSNIPSSMIANYVYYHWMRNEVTQSTGLGEVSTKSENAVRVSPSGKMTRAWNEMVEQVWKLVAFLDTNVSDYTGWNWYGDTESQYQAGYSRARLKDMFYPINSFNL